MIKIAAYCPLHYGAEYLDVAIRAIDPFVEKIIILYTDKPSYGHGTLRENPDTELGMRIIAQQVSKKIEWHNVSAYAENEHRGLVHNYIDNTYDGILAFDADEVFEPEDVQSFVEYCHNSKDRLFGVDGYINFWKSFNHACYDGFRPIRYTNLHNAGGRDVNAKCRIYHFSTAQRLDIMRYKLDIHGHKNEIRPNWLSMYENWTSGQVVDKGLHLVAHDLWNAVEFDKNTMPAILKQHTNFNKEVII